MDLKLTVELRLPRYAQGRNLRKTISNGLWDKIRKEIYVINNNKCEICGEYDERLHAHEIWEFDENKFILRLTNIQCLCWNCHGLKHLYRSAIRSNSIKYLIEHFMKVNQCDAQTYKEHLRELKRNDIRNPLNYLHLPIMERTKVMQNNILREETLSKEKWKFLIYDDMPFYGEIINELKSKDLLA